MNLGPYAIEQDYSHYVAYASDVIFAVVGTASKGPIGVPTVCTSPRDLTNKFGPVKLGYHALYAGQYFLNQASKMFFVRAAAHNEDGTTTATKGVVTLTGLSASGDVSSALVLNTKEIGSYLNGYGIKVISSKDKDENPITILDLVTPAGVVVEQLIVDITKMTVGDTLGSNYLEVQSIDPTATALKATDTARAIANGSDGVDGIKDADYISAADELKSDIYDMNVFAVPGISSATVITSMLSLAEQRGDCVFIVDPPATVKTPTEVEAWHNGRNSYSDHTKFNSSFGVLYFSWQRIYDSINKAYVSVPPSVVVAPIMAKSARESEIWFPVAGIRRGLVSGVYAPEYSPDTAERDNLYSGENCVNCIIEDPISGLVIFGQKTLYRENTALNRLNVRMLLNYLKRIVTAACRYLTFEPNDRTTWNNFEDLVEPTLRSIGERRGLYDYKIVKGEAIVTDDDIDNYRMPCKILIKPTKAAEEIPIYFTITSTGADFNEVLESEGIIEI